MTPQPFDPTADERARATREGREDARLVTDPTAGERARRIREGLSDPEVTDPTDPRHGSVPAGHVRVPEGRTRR